MPGHSGRPVLRERPGAPRAMRYEFHPEAEVDLLETILYYEAQAPGLGEKFAAEVRLAKILDSDPDFPAGATRGKRSARPRHSLFTNSEHGLPHRNLTTYCSIDTFAFREIRK